MSAHSQPRDHSHPLKLESHTLPEGREAAEWLLRNHGVTLSLIRMEGGADLLLTAAHLDERGHEVAVISLVVPREKIQHVQEYLLTQGIRAGGVIGYDEAFAVLGQLAVRESLTRSNHLFQLSPSQISSGQLITSGGRSVSESIPADQRDVRTGMRSKAALLDRQALEGIANEIPGNKVLVFLDFNSMSVANKCGLGGGVDEILKGLRAVADDVFKERKHEIFRLGGDEFGIVVSNSEDGLLDSLSEFKDAVGKLRDEKFKENVREMAKAEEYARVRSEARRLFVEFADNQEVHDRVDFSTRNFRNWIVRKLGVLEPGFLPDRRATGALAVHLAKERVKLNLDSPSAGVMTFSMSAVEIGDAPRPDDISRALGAADRVIHQAKEGGAAFDGIVPYSELEKIKIRDSQVIVSTNITNTNSGYRISSVELQRLQSFAADGLSDLARRSAEATVTLNSCIDPTIGHGVLRYGVAQNIPLQSLILADEINWMSGIIIDVNHFGVINNQFGYDRADALISRIASAVRDEFPSALIVRKDGGKLVIFTQWRSTSVETERILMRAEYALTETVNTERATAEYYMRITLDNELLGITGQRSQNRALRRVNLADSVIAPYPSMTVGEAVAALEGNAKPLTPIRSRINVTSQ